MYSDIQRWNLKYREGDRHQGQEPDSTLVNAKRWLAAGGDALDLACGLGQNSRLLQTWGYEVYAVDGSVEALRRARAQSDKNEANSFVADLDTYPLPAGRFDLIIVVHYLNRGLINRIIDALKPGGRIFFKTFNQNRLMAYPEFNSNYVLKPGELDIMFAELHKIAGADPDAVEPEVSWIVAVKR